MVAMAYETPSQQEILLEEFLALDTPPGFRAELIEGEVVVAPPPAGDHEDVIGLIIDQVATRSSVKMQMSMTKGLTVPSVGLAPRNHVIPDISIAPMAMRLFRGAEPWMPSDGVEMVVEVTSSKPDRDRKDKRLSYALGGIPLYLLIDRSEGRVSLLSNPKNGDYDELSRPFGETIPLPAPFDFLLDTTDFL
ncbi:Uma2 family endonuclease [Uniformispora flossi]|uniref:Uma2 family endonuclease n=1 Tax=Uniformispora flossi TaxID=3390723 RepID=UPI003C2B5948